MKFQALTSTRRANRGVSLIELMVGVAIGLIGVVAIFQAVTVWTKHTQTTSSGSDAQVAGTLALFNIERELKQAGYGFGTASNAIMGCNVQSNVAGVNMRPVEITPGVPAGSPDTISVLLGNSSVFVDETDFIDSTPATKRLNRLGAFRAGDVAIIAGAVPPGGPMACMFIGLTSNIDPNGWIQHDQNVVFPARLNLAVPPAFVAGKIYNLGPRPRYDAWTVDPNRNILSRIDSLADAPAAIPVADGIVSMKAEYGYDADGNGQITNVEWIPVLPAAPDWTRVLAVRVAVLVRGRQFERNADSESTGTAAVTPTAANPSYFGGQQFLMRNVDGTADGFADANADPNNWRYYRYRVYERVIPLRNMLWGIYG